MAEQSRKQTLITELAAARTHLARDIIVVGEDMDFGARIESNYARHYSVWLSGAAILGLMLSRLLPSRGKGAVGPGYRDYRVEKPGKAALIFTVLKFAVSLAKPALMNYLAKKTQTRSEIR